HRAGPEGGNAAHRPPAQGRDQGPLRRARRDGDVLDPEPEELRSRAAGGPRGRSLPARGGDAERLGPRPPGPRRGGVGAGRPLMAGTLCDIFYESVALGKPDHLRYKRDGAWHDVTSDEFRAAVEELSMGLRAIGIERGDRVAILGENRPEWAFADLATLCAGAVDAPIYATLTPSQVLYILK